MDPPVKPRDATAVAADALTALRGLIAVALVIAVGWRHPMSGAALLGLAWLTDVSDGRVARRSATATRLGRWDLHFDAAVGAGLLTGLIAAGYVPGPAFAAAGGAATIWFLYAGNPAGAMALQAVAYGPFLAVALRDATAGFWGLVGVLGSIAIVDARHLVEWVLPTFFAGLLSPRRPRR